MTEAVAKHIKKLHQLEKKGNLEVEDLLKILKTPNKEYITPLREMVAQYDWQPLNDELIVPFASWVDALCIYLEEGVQGLVKSIHKTKDFFSIIFGVLKGLPTEESLPAFLEIAQNFSAKITDEQEDFVKEYTPVYSVSVALAIASVFFGLLPYYAVYRLLLRIVQGCNGHL